MEPRTHKKSNWFFETVSTTTQFAFESNNLFQRRPKSFELISVCMSRWQFVRPVRGVHKSRVCVMNPDTLGRASMTGTFDDATPQQVHMVPWILCLAEKVADGSLHFHVLQTCSENYITKWTCVMLRMAVSSDGLTCRCRMKTDD